MQALIVEPMKEPYLKEIESGLKSLQAEVGGYIEAIYPYEEPVALICNEEGKLNGLPLNRALRSEAGEIYDIVAGTFMVVGIGEEDFCSLPDDLAKQFHDKFRTPEQFMQMDGQIIALPVKPPKRQAKSIAESLAKSEAKSKAPTAIKQPYNPER